MCTTDKFSLHSVVILDCDVRMDHIQRSDTGFLRTKEIISDRRPGTVATNDNSSR